MVSNSIIIGVVTRFHNYKKSIMNVGYYFMASFIPMLINLFLSPVYALNLTAEDFGIVGYFTSFTTLLSPLFLFHINQYYMREYFFRGEKDREPLRIMAFQTFLVFPFIILILSLSGVFIYMRVFNSDTTIPFSPYAFLSLLPLALVGIYRLELIDCKVQRRGRDFFKINITNSFLLILFTVVFVVVVKWGATGKMLGALFPPLIMFIWALFRNKHLIREKFNWGMFRSAIVFCLPLVIAGMLGFFSNGFDKLYLEKAVSLDQLGIYTIGLTIAGYLNVFSDAIGETFNPDIYESIAQKNNRRALKYIFIQIAIMTVIVSIFILLAKYAIMILTANRYLESTPYARIASLVTISTLIHYSVTPFINAAKKNWLILYKDILGSIVCVCLYSYFIRNYGLMGAAWAFAINPLFYALFAFSLYKISLMIDSKKKQYDNE